MAGATGRCTCGALAVAQKKDEPGIPAPRQVGSFDLAKTPDEDAASATITVHYFDNRPCRRYDPEDRARMLARGERLPT